jgi:hypothetical protein
MDSVQIAEQQRSDGGALQDCVSHCQQLPDLAEWQTHCWTQVQPHHGLSLVHHKAVWIRRSVDSQNDKVYAPIYSCVYIKALMAQHASCLYTTIIFFC